MSLINAQEKEKEIAQLMQIPYHIKKLNIGEHIINYLVAGNGPPLLLIHGINIGWGQWYKNIPELSKYFTVYAIDLPGSGFSSSAGVYSSGLEKLLIKTIEEFILRLKLDPVNLIGHSLGGWVVLKLALRKRINIKKIVLVDSLGFTTYVPWRYKLLSFSFLTRLLMSTVMRPSKNNMRSFLTSVIQEKETVDEIFIDYFLHAIKSHGVHPFIFINKISGFFKVKKELVLIDQLSKIKQPTLIIMGENDPLVRVVDIHKTYILIPNAKLEVFLNTGHVPQFENVVTFNNLVVQFLC